MSTAATREDIDRAEERITAKIAKLHERVDDHNQRITRAETRLERAVDDLGDNVRKVGALEGTVTQVTTEIAGARDEIKRATGVLEGALSKIDEIRSGGASAEEVVTALRAANEAEAEASRNWRKQWRDAATPTNLARLVFGVSAFVTVLVAFLKGQADVADIRAALEAANQIPPVVQPAPEPMGPLPEMTP